MFLNNLTQEKKELFLSLAYNISCIDDNYADEEKMVLEQYCVEMDIRIDKIQLIEDFDKILNRINILCNFQEKKIFVFESVGLILADGVIHDKEMEAITNMVRLFEINDNYFEDCMKLIKEYYDLQSRMMNLINT
uniref:hypothetical protein n=1 Tax=Holdemanella biformis TaxID=1735 RepID=UPI004024AF84